MAGSKTIWSAAIVLSLITHAGAAAILTLSPEPDPDVAQVAGGAVVAEVAMLGNNAFDAIESGAPDEIQPTEEMEPETIEPVAQPVAEIEPQEVVPDEITPSEVAPTPEAEEFVPEMSEAIEIQGAEVEIAAIPIPDIRPEIVEKPPEAIQPLEKKVEKPAEKKPEKKKAKKSGDKGNSPQAAQRGEVNGSDGVSMSSPGGQKKGSATVGNAAVSNYPGKVRSKINRAKRRVRGAGVVTVAFTVSSSGQATSIRIAKSSGEPDVDQAAIEAVRRAAPFPEIPAGAGRSSWPFNVPIVFKR
jgi:protein TonB